MQVINISPGDFTLFQDVDTLMSYFFITHNYSPNNLTYKF